MTINSRNTTFEGMAIVLDTTIAKFCRNNFENLTTDPTLFDGGFVRPIVRF